MEKKKPLKVELEWKLLERISEYYEFPTIAFLSPESVFKEKTRHLALLKRIRGFNREVAESRKKYFGEFE